MSEAEKVGLLYKLLKQRDEDRKFRKTIDKRQITLEESIARKIKEMKNDGNS